MTIAATQGQATPGGMVLAAEPEKPKDGTEEAPKPTPVPGPTTTGFPVPPTNHLPGAPTELKKVTLPPYVIEPPDVLIVEAVKALPDQDIRGQAVVRPDGTISLGIYGSVYVAGKTLEQARDAIYHHLTDGAEPRLSPSKFKPDALYVDVMAYNSKVVMSSPMEQVTESKAYRIPITGSETALMLSADQRPAAGGLEENLGGAAEPAWPADPAGGLGWHRQGRHCSDELGDPARRSRLRELQPVDSPTAVQRFPSPFERILGATPARQPDGQLDQGQGQGFGNTGERSADGRGTLRRLCRSCGGSAPRPARRCRVCLTAGLSRLR
jgi:hypothetical protein